MKSNFRTLTLLVTMEMPSFFVSETLTYSGLGTILEGGGLNVDMKRMSKIESCRRLR
jgi:hypothetical protein